MILKKSKGTSSTRFYSECHNDKDHRLGTSSSKKNLFKLISSLSYHQSSANQLPSRLLTSGERSWLLYLITWNLTDSPHIIQLNAFHLCTGCALFLLKVPFRIWNRIRKRN
ncbi:hypothetical protein AVEN_169995-1 [Araneus ventricosus]|uniref:Uncharacterized protein n=1 Tax=Araneus ventricosus TaxID=182803 RepID=A0A4Y2WJ87_ARAVE|nr:hypothetical protein AVEN_169995-1 [Araneus ventricosus]